MTGLYPYSIEENFDEDPPSLRPKPSDLTVQEAIMSSDRCKNLTLNNVSVDGISSVALLDPWNQEALNVVGCAVTELLNKKTTDKWRRFFNYHTVTRLKIIGENLGSEGMATLLYLGHREQPSSQTPSPFVAKVSIKKKESQEEIFNEAGAGILALNSLRSKVPNFAYIFGLFRCGFPPILPDFAVLTTKTKRL